MEEEDESDDDAMIEDIEAWDECSSVPIKNALKNGSSFDTILKDHQKEGVSFLMARADSNTGAILAFSMGLGKTLTTIAALTKLQLNADIKNSIYLTYAHTNHNQLPSDSSFTISQETFRSVLFHYVKIHHKNIPDEKRANWVDASVKAKNTFDVYYCRDKTKKVVNKGGLPHSGTWILPDVLNRDIVIIWRRP